jgi:hypothetical protein
MGHVAKNPKPKTAWQTRLEHLQSLSLDGVVEEINRERFSKLLSLLAAPSAREKDRMARLIKMHDAGELIQLPTDQRANAVRMRRVLIGLHRRCGNFPSCVVDVPRLASDSLVTPATCERAVRDLAEGKLVIANRKRARPARYGGQGPSSYQIVWSTIADLARTQGVQGSLFQSDLPPPCAGALPHSAGALPHSAGALPHKPGANARADASFHSFFQNPSPSPSSPREPLPHAVPSAHVAELPPAKSEEEKGSLVAGWEAAEQALREYGIYLSRDAARGAQAHRWSADQVLALLADCRARSIATAEGPVQAWGAGLVFRHLQLTPAGTPIRLPPAEAYVRAKRDQELRTAAARDAVRQADEARAAVAREEAAARARDEDEALLTALSADETAAIAAAILARHDFLKRFIRRQPDAGGRTLKRLIAEELRTRAAVARGETDQEDQT